MAEDSPLAIGCAVIGILAFALQILTCYSPQLLPQKLGFDKKSSTAFFFSTIGILHFALDLVVLGLSASLLEKQIDNAHIIPEIVFTLCASIFALVVSIPSLFIRTQKYSCWARLRGKHRKFRVPEIFFLSLALMCLFGSAIALVVRLRGANCAASSVSISHVISSFDAEFQS